jgi:hypothetical protein
VKTAVDLANFFRNEQSIPPLSSWWSEGDNTYRVGRRFITLIT